MNAFDISAVLTLNSTQYDAGLAKAKGGATGLGGSLSKIGAIAKVGFAAAGAAAVAFGVKSIKTGMDFDKSMSQVAATMGKTVEELNTQTVSADTSMGHFNGTLRDFAKKMGSETQFTAKESADALNYMALAGYDAEKSVKMLPNVLNLAAAGNMELASASDMVTDAQSALGLSTEETTEMVDKMAKTASKSNTSVEQLGSAFLTVGGTAKSLRGGTTELAQVLGLLADNGIKGSEGGTKLRNMILSLSAPTGKAAKELENLGVKTLDSEGNFRSMQDIMGDLSKALDGMGSGEKNDILNKIFNKQDLKAVNALLGTSKDRWSELSSAIDDSQGAAEKMAKTQLDNLQGDVTKLKSAFEGVQVAVAEKLTPALRTLAKGGTKILSGITDALKKDMPKGKLEMMEIKGGVDIPDFESKIRERISKLATEIPKWLKDAMPKLEDFTANLREKIGSVVDLGVEFIKNIGTGIANGIPTLVEHIPTIITNLAGIINDNAPKLILAGVGLILKLVVGLIKAIPEIVKNIPSIIKAAVSCFMAFNWLGLGKKLIVSLAKGIKASGPAIKSKAISIAKAIPKAIKKGIGNLGTVAKDVFSKFITATINAGKTIGSKVAKFAKSIPKKIKDGIGNLASIGRDAISGLYEGFKSKFRGMVEKIKGLTKLLPKAVKKILGIASPSKVFRYEIGQRLPESLALGIKDKMKDVYDASDMMAHATEFSPTSGRLMKSMEASSSSGAQTVGEIVGEIVADALDGMDIVLDRRAFGKMTRKAVGGAI